MIEWMNCTHVVRASFKVFSRKELKLKRKKIQIQKTWKNEIKCEIPSLKP